jgi:deoxyguanosinetriphosphate triphosphohydrolase, putative
MAKSTTYRIEWDKYLVNTRLRTSRKNKVTAEDIKTNHESYDFRTDFDSDFGRVIFSSASRRMHDKTQVFPLSTDDNIHTRLTHSLEVMNIGANLGLDLCQSEEYKELYGKEELIQMTWDISGILRVASYIHDIGNPPFGHFGEESIQSYFKDLFETTIIEKYTHKIILGGKFELKNISENYYNSFKRFIASDEIFDFTEFDGNAEGFRIVTKLQYLNDLFGLNLTFASLGAYLKYPNTGRKIEKYIASHKHGVFYTEKDYLDIIANTCSCIDEKRSYESNKPIYKRHPLSFLVEAADSICYLIMDIEDAVSKKYFTFKDLCGFIIGNQTLTDIIKDIKKKDKEGNNGVQSSDKKLLVDFRVKVISYLVDLAIKNFLKNHEAIDKGEYQDELINIDKNMVVEDLKSITKKYIFPNRDIISLELTGNSVISGIFDIYFNLVFNDNENLRKRAKLMISRAILEANTREYVDEYNKDKAVDKKKQYFDINTFDIGDLPIEVRLRIIRDFVSGMTDKFALTHFKKISGQQV